MKNYKKYNRESESILGELASQYDRSEVVLSDKFTPAMQDDTKENPVEDMLEGSLKRLGTDTSIFIGFIMLQTLSVGHRFWLTWSN